MENSNVNTATCVSSIRCNKLKCQKNETSMKSAILKTIIAIYIILLSISNLNAQSTVYFMTQSFANCTRETFTINGEFAGNFFSNDNIKEETPSKIYYPTSRKCILQEEGRYVFKVTMLFFTRNFQDYSIESIRPYYAEKQINTTTGSTHYLYFTFKGLNDFQIKEISEKEAIKYMSNKDCVVLPQFIEK